jgi:hypothetical protein
LELGTLGKRPQFFLQATSAFGLRKALDDARPSNVVVVVVVVVVAGFSGRRQ